MYTKGDEVNKIFLFVIIIVFLTLRLFLNYYINLPLHFDEAQYWDWSRNLDWGYFSKPPALALFIKIVTDFCGNGEACVKSLSPIFHSFTAIVIFYSVYSITKNYGKSLFGAFLYLFMPGVMFSSLMISTDVPLVFFSSVIAFLIIKIFYSKNNVYNYIFLAFALAFGILSKYAAAYILVSIFIAVLIIKDSRVFFINRNILFTLIGVILLIMPNIYWNFQNDFVTFSHTASNANLKEIEFNIFEAFTFFLSQIFIFGMVPFIVLCYKISLFIRTSTIQKVMLLNFIIPIFVVLLIAIFSRANANWAVVGYPFGCIYLATIIGNEKFTRNACLVNQLIFSLTILLFILTIPTFKIDPFYKIRHIKYLAEKIKVELNNTENVAFMADDREDFAHLQYYLKDIEITKVKWNGDSKINDHYELTTDVEDLENKNVLFLTRTKPTKEILKRTETHRKVLSYKHSFFNKHRNFNIFLLERWQ